MTTLLALIVVAATVAVLFWLSDQVMEDSQPRLFVKIALLIAALITAIVLLF